MDTKPLAEGGRISIKTKNWEIQAQNSEVSLSVLIAKRSYDRMGNYMPLTPEDLKELEENLQDFEKWRTYRQLNTELHNNG
jgi:hypothetical protein